MDTFATHRRQPYLSVCGLFMSNATFGGMACCCTCRRQLATNNTHAKLYLYMNASIWAPDTASADAVVVFM